MPEEPTQEFIASHTTIVMLTDGTRMLVRPITPDDKGLLVEGFSHLSPETRFRRFLGYMDKLRPPLLRYLTEIDYVDHFAWVGLDADTGHGIGVARYVGEALAENQPIRELLENLGARVYDAGAGEVAFEVDLPASAEDVKGTALYRALRAAAEGRVVQVPPASHETKEAAVKVKGDRARVPRPG